MLGLLVVLVTVAAVVVALYAHRRFVALTPERRERALRILGELVQRPTPPLAGVADEPLGHVRILDKRPRGYVTERRRRRAAAAAAGAVPASPTPGTGELRGEARRRREREAREASPRLRDPDEVERLAPPDRGEAVVIRLPRERSRPAGALAGASTGEAGDREPASEDVAGVQRAATSLVRTSLLEEETTRLLREGRRGRIEAAVARVLTHRGPALIGTAAAAVILALVGVGLALRQPSSGGGGAPAPVTPAQVAGRQAQRGPTPRPQLAVHFQSAREAVVRAQPPYSLTIWASGRCWVQVRTGAEGPSLFEGVLEPGDVQTFEGAGPLRIRLGNPPAVRIQLNDAPLRLDRAKEGIPLTLAVEASRT